MAFQLLSASAVTAILIIISIFIVYRRRISWAGPIEMKLDHADLISNSQEHNMLSKSLASALPDSIIFPQDAVAFKQSMNSYWAQQEREVIPACVVRPRDVRQLCTAVTVLKREYDERRKQAGEKRAEGLFTIRSGGHSPVSGAASIKGGVVIDLSLFCEVTPSEDGSTVIIGAGAKWMNVSKLLDEKGLAVVGGRNSAVGVGGLTLGGRLLLFTPHPTSSTSSFPPAVPLVGFRIDTKAHTGGLSFFSPRFGLVCSNIVSYEVVLASGSVTTASALVNPDLWRALKGGSNNFGIVTRFTARSFPSAKIWSGFLYMPACQAAKVLAAFHECVDRADPGNPGVSYDQFAAGPIACFSFIPKVGIQVISVNLVYTKSLERGLEKKWPPWWGTSAFGSLWRFWSTCKVRTLTSATDELNTLNPPGRRQVFATTTIKNDPATLTAVHAVYRDAMASIREASIPGLVWTLVLQPLLPEWARKGDANPLGLQDESEPLVIVSFTVNWADRRDDDFVQKTTRHAIEQIDAAAATHHTGHPYRYLNYCAAWQQPFASYGIENWRFLQHVSRKYDPAGLFQKACVGGFKLDLVDAVDAEV